MNKMNKKTLLGGIVKLFFKNNEYAPKKPSGY